MAKFEITNIQRRTASGSFIGLAHDMIVEARSEDVLSEIVRKALGDKGSPSFSYEAA